MQKLALVALLFGVIGLNADVIPTLESVSPQADGTFLFSYLIDIAGDQQLEPMASNCDPGLGANCVFADAFFIFDFGELVYNASHPITSPAGWGANIVQSGPLLSTYGQELPPGTSEPEIEFYDYTAPAVTGPQTGICCFNAYSATNQETNGFYNGQGTKFSSPIDGNGTIQGNEGALITPAAFPIPEGNSTPEPGSLLLFSGALLCFGVYRYRHRISA